MDSVTQFTLGAAIGEAVLGRKVGNRAALWGGITATLPDLDVFVPLGDVVRDFTYHRSASHSLLLLAIATPLMAWLIGRIHPDVRTHKVRWLIMIYLAFATHVLLDSCTAYGTQIFWPISDIPVTWSTIFIIDPLYTLPLLMGVLAAMILTRASDRGHLLNRAGLIVSSTYLAWTVAAKVIVEHRFERELVRKNIGYDELFTTPAPFNSLLWRAVVMDDTGYYEGYQSILDSTPEIRWRRYTSDKSLLRGIEDYWPVRRLQWFSRGIYSVSLQQQDIIISDLRMGVEPHYVFRFKVGEMSNPHAVAAAVEQLPPYRDLGLLPLIWWRIWDQSVELPG